MARFTLPRDLYHGKGALDALKTFEGKRAMVCVGGGSMKRFGFLDTVVANLKEAGMEVELFEGIEPDPSVDTVMRGAAAMEKFQPDWIVAIGGGSPIDAAKAMWIKYEYPDITFEDMCKVFGIPPLRRKMKTTPPHPPPMPTPPVSCSPSSPGLNRNTPSAADSATTRRLPWDVRREVKVFQRRNWKNSSGSTAAATPCPILTSRTSGNG